MNGGAENEILDNYLSAYFDLRHSGHDGHSRVVLPGVSRDGVRPEGRAVRLGIVQTRGRGQEGQQQQGKKEAAFKVYHCH